MVPHAQVRELSQAKFNKRSIVLRAQVEAAVRALLPPSHYANGWDVWLKGGSALAEIGAGHGASRERVTERRTRWDADPNGPRPESKALFDPPLHGHVPHIEMQAL